MADPVKTRILRAVRNLIDSLDVIGEVVINPATPPDRETATYPVAFVFDEPEQKVQRNRYAINIMPLHIEVWFRAEMEDASDQADLIDSAIYTALLADDSIKALVMDIRPDEVNSVTKQFVDEYLGVLVMRWVVKYGHRWGDPTDIQRA